MDQKEEPGTGRADTEGSKCRLPLPSVVVSILAICAGAAIAWAS